MTRTLLSTLLMLLPPAVGMAQVEFIKTPVRVDPCVNDLFFVDVPLEADINDIPPNFEQDLQADLTALARANVGWFCDHNTCDPLRAPGRLVARVARLLPRRDSTRVEKRFLRIGFYYLPKPGRMANAQRLTVRDAAVCTAVAGLKTTIAGLWPDDVTPPFSGRACAASSQAGPPRLRPGVNLRHLGPALNDNVLNWHLTRMSVDDPAPSNTPIVLIDTGVDPERVPQVQQWAVPEPVLPARYDRFGRPVIPQPEPTHPHGTEMALAMRQITTAPIIDLPALGAAGRVPLGQIARAVDSAAAQVGKQPAVINLSLGWAPEIEHRRKLLRDGCLTEEDPAGEAMRAVLASTRQRHSQQLVVAAGGNRAQLGTTYVQTFGQRTDASPPQGSSAKDAFYPGHWGLRPTHGAPTVLTVGAMQSNGRLAGMDQGQAALYAPGQHVYLRAPSDPPVDPCAPGQAELQFPRAVTGSSIAAAFTAALATRIWSHWPTSDAPTAARLLYLAAEPIGLERAGRLYPHKSATGTLARRLNAERLDTLLRANPRALRPCFDGNPIGFTGPSVSSTCRRALEGLGFDERLRPQSPSAVWTRPTDPICPAQYPAGDDPIGRLGRGSICDDAPALCETNDLYSAGDAGPQPEDLGGCDDCMLFHLPDGRIRMRGRINSRFPEGTLFKNPWLIVNWSGSSYAYVNLSTSSQIWAAGASIDINNITLNMQGRSLSDANVFLYTRIKTPKQTSGTADFSPVRGFDFN